METLVPLKLPESKSGYPMTFIHLGKSYYHITLYAPTWASRKKWLDHISKQQDLMEQRSLVFDTSLMTEGFFAGPNVVRCAVPFGTFSFGYP
jgi:RHO1 GDP-GTP exchange protein 1/2